MSDEAQRERDTSDVVSRMRRRRQLLDELAALIARGELDRDRLDLVELDELERRRCQRSLWCELERGHVGPCQLEESDSDQYPVALPATGGTGDE